MPARQPFTLLCQLAARGRHTGRADLHLHTTHSDGTYTPAQVVELGRRSGLAALAITDHDTISAIPEARQANISPRPGSPLEIIPAVEITTELRGHEFHLLAYFVDIGNPNLLEALARARRYRLERFQVMVDQLRLRGLRLEWTAPDGSPTLGRRNLAELLVKAGHVGSVREAFARYLKDGLMEAPRQRLAVAEAIALVRQAGGVACWAHPGAHCDLAALAELRRLGLGAVEVEYPEVRRGRVQQLRVWARELGLAVTGGSDCHGPGRRAVGACTISAEELEHLRLRVGKERPLG